MATGNLILFYAKLLLVCLLNLAAALTPEERTACTRGLVCGVNKNKLDFFVVGDTGGIELNVGVGVLNYIRPTTVQTRVAEAMARLAGKKGLDFVLNVGDNVYFNGVDSVNDTRFDSVFEKPYADKRLDVPWYMLAGNHDYLGNVKAQIEYTKRSNKWTFPSPYYKLNYAFMQYSKKVDFIFIDTVILCGNTIDIDSRSLFSWMKASEKIPEKPDPQFLDESKKQWTWLKDELRKSRADYLFVVGHYPIYSISLQRLKCLHEKLDPLLRKYQVTAYIAGHDHSVQYFRDDGDHKSGRVPMRYLVSGAGSRTGAWGAYAGDEQAKLLYRFPKKVEIPFVSRLIHHKRNEFGMGQGGFVHFTLGEHRADLYFYAKNLTLEFQESIAPRKIKDFEVEKTPKIRRFALRKQQMGRRPETRQ